MLKKFALDKKTLQKIAFSFGSSNSTQFYFSFVIHIPVEAEAQGSSH